MNFFVSCILIAIGIVVARLLEGASFSWLSRAVGALMDASVISAFGSLMAGAGASITACIAHKVAVKWEERAEYPYLFQARHSFKDAVRRWFLLVNSVSEIVSLENRFIGKLEPTSNYISCWSLLLTIERLLMKFSWQFIKWN